MRMNKAELITSLRLAAKYLPATTATLLNEAATRLDVTSAALSESLEQRNALAAEKRIAELENDEVRQRLANAEHQLHMAELAKYNLRAGRKAQFRKRKVAEKRIAELEGGTLTVPDGFAAIGENIRTQDNRITSDPLFCVFQKREIVVDEDYDCDRIVWVDEDGREATERQRIRLELLHQNFREPPEKWRRVAVKDIDDFVTCCFTEQGCKDYLACNGHNLRQPFIYVTSGFRNDEYQAVRNWLAGIALDTGE